MAVGQNARELSNRLIREGLERQANPQPGETQEQALHAAFALFVKAWQTDETNWVALMHGGINRCNMGSLAQRMLRDRMNTWRAEGRSEVEIAHWERVGKERIEKQYLEQGAYQTFVKMDRVQRQYGEGDQNLLLFANAMMKFANGQLLKAHRGQPGAIDDLKTLAKRKWEVERCAELIARCYMQLGAQAFEMDDFDGAQVYWDKGLKWARSERTKRYLLTNKAGAYEMDNEFGPAETIVREQIKKEPDFAAHWKNLGLVLGYRNHLREALYCYARVRNLTGGAKGATAESLLHGNAWLRAAMIHGKLLELDGDLEKSWDLFMQYRAVFGDDYNFCFSFGEFLFHVGEYDLSWKFLTHARDLQPSCPNPRLVMVRVVQRLSEGTREERAQLRKQTKEGLEAVQREYSAVSEMPSFKRICAGLTDLGDAEIRNVPAKPIEPDPLAGYGPGQPAPDWLLAKAKKRETFEGYEMAPSEFLRATRDKMAVLDEDDLPQSEGAVDVADGFVWWPFAVGLGVGGVVVFALARRRRAA